MRQSACRLLQSPHYNSSQTFLTELSKYAIVYAKTVVEMFRECIFIRDAPSVLPGHDFCHIVCCIDCDYCSFLNFIIILSALLTHKPVLYRHVYISRRQSTEFLQHFPYFRDFVTVTYSAPLANSVVHDC